MKNAFYFFFIKYINASHSLNVVNAPLSFPTSIIIPFHPRFKLCFKMISSGSYITPYKFVNGGDE